MGNNWNEWNENQNENQTEKVNTQNSNVEDVSVRPVQEENCYYTAGTPYNEPQEPPKRMRKSGGFAKTMAKVVAIAVVFGLVSSAVFIGVVKVTGGEVTKGGSVVMYQDKSVESNAKQLSSATDVPAVVDAVMPSIVAITNTSEQEVQGFFFGSQTQKVQYAGSGILVGEDDNNLYIVTNNHVVADALELKVTFVDNESVEAEVKGTDAGKDLAVVTVKKSALKSSTKDAIKLATIGDSSSAKVGESVIAIGNALGYGQSVTTGVVSALNRSITVEDISTSFMQTSAAINPGNSGGALLNSKGEVIGINSAKIVDEQTEGMGYAIPINDAQPIVEALISRELVDEKEKGALGIYPQDISQDIASVYNLPVGVYIQDMVKDGAAAKAGLVQGDIITAIDGFEVKTTADLQGQLRYYKAGTEVEITAQVKEGGKYVEKKVKVTLQKSDSSK